MLRNLNLPAFRSLLHSKYGLGGDPSRHSPNDRELPLGRFERALHMVFLIYKIVPVVRRQILVGAFLAVLSVMTPAVLSASPKPPRVLFICQFGTAKSAIARELFKRRAAERGIPVTVFSRGITPEPHLAPSTRDVLLAEGIVLDAEEARKLSAVDLRAADIVVIFNQLPAPMRKRNPRDWSDVPSVNDTYPLARAELDRRIDLLINELARLQP